MDGVVGPLTWNKIYEVYTDLINGLLTSDQRPGVYPGTPLRVGSTGRAVKEVQYYLYLLSAYFPEIPVIAYDGVFGAATEKAVRAYQQLFGLTVDGIVGRATWDSIYQRFTTLRNVDGPMLNLRVLAYPGYDLQEGSQGEIVKFVQFMLAYIGVFYDPILPIDGLTGVYGPETAASAVSYTHLHDAHAVQKQRNTACKIDHVKNRHKFLRLTTFFPKTKRLVCAPAASFTES